MTTTATTPPSAMSGETILARLLALEADAVLRDRAPNVRRPTGLQLLSAFTVQDARVTLGLGALQSNSLANFTLNR